MSILLSKKELCENVVEFWIEMWVLGWKIKIKKYVDDGL